jgi:hypothetical protein
MALNIGLYLSFHNMLDWKVIREKTGEAEQYESLHNKQ